MDNKELIEEGKNAYGQYMYYECAESGYNSQQATFWQREYYRLCRLAVEVGVDSKLFEGES